MKQHVAFLVLLVLLSTGATSAANCTDDLDAMPSWEKETLGERLGTFFLPWKLVEFHVLSWNTRSDDRPLKIDSFLLWTKWITDKDEPKWAIVSAFRWPDDNYHREWSLPSISHSAYNPYAEFDREPIEADVMQFFSEHRKYNSIFPLKFKLLNGGVRRNTWRCLFGAVPSENISIENIYESY